MNTSAQPLDHRAFLQQYVLTRPFETSISPEQFVSEANAVWGLIEKAVHETAAANSTQSLQRPDAVCKHLQIRESEDRREIICVCCGEVLNRTKPIDLPPMSKRP